MKSYLFVTAVVLSLSLGAMAQDRAIQPDVEAAIAGQPDPTKVPMMIVREAPDKPKANVVLSTMAAALSAKAGGAAKGISRPLVMGGGAPSGFSLGDATTGNPDYDRLVLESAIRNGVDPALMVEVMRQESGFNARAHSYKGACGLMQLMPGTAARFGVTRISEPAKYIESGAKYLRVLMYRETQAYVHNISSRYGSSDKSGRAKAPAQAVPNKPMVMPSGPNGSLSNNY